jgi:hypothetical protein
MMPPTMGEKHMDNRLPISPFCQNDTIQTTLIHSAATQSTELNFVLDTEKFFHCLSHLTEADALAIIIREETHNPLHVDIPTPKFLADPSQEYLDALFEMGGNNAAIR